jgi:predicted RNA binding protein YcfA (HicA-like mRNA interferase family)
MGPSLPSITPRQMERLLLARGFVLVPHRGKGGHRIYAHPHTGQRTMIGFHGTDLPTGTLRTIMKQAGLTRDDLTKKPKRASDEEPVR